MSLKHIFTFQLRDDFNFLNFKLFLVPLLVSDILAVFYFSEF